MGLPATNGAWGRDANATAPHLTPPCAACPGRGWPHPAVAVPVCEHWTDAPCRLIAWHAPSGTLWLTYTILWSMMPCSYGLNNLET